MFFGLKFNNQSSWIDELYDDWFQINIKMADEYKIKPRLEQPNLTTLFFINLKDVYNHLLKSFRVTRIRL